MACLSVGTNDVLFAWDAEAFAARLGRIVEVAGASAERVVVPTITLSLARFPGGGAEFRHRVEEANTALAACGALVTAGDDLSGARLLQPDRVHPTERGQLLLADRAATALGVTPSPSSLADAPVGSGRWVHHREAARAGAAASDQADRAPPDVPGSAWELSLTRRRRERRPRRTGPARAPGRGGCARAARGGQRIT